jgi:hypothetical protein
VLIAIGVVLVVVVGVVVVNILAARPSGLARPLAEITQPSTDRPRGTAAEGEEKPTGQQRKEFLFRLAVIAPWLLDEDLAISAGRATCRDIVQGKTDAEVVKNAQQRFTDVSSEQAQQIVEAVKAWCKP